MAVLHRSALLVSATILGELMLFAGPPRGSDAVCYLISTVLPETEIRLAKPMERGPYVWRGELIHLGRGVLPFQLSMFQGYGSRIWAVPGTDGRGEYAIAFRAGVPMYSLERPGRADAFLFAGLGAELHNRSAGTEEALSRAGEGFWRVGEGCRDQFLFGSEAIER